MLDETRTRQKRTQERDVLSTDSIIEAGLAVTGVMEGGVMKSRRSDGTTNSIFQGVSWITNSRGTPAIPQLLQGKTGAADSGGTGYASFVLPYAVADANDLLVLLGSGYGSPALTAATLVNTDSGTEYNLDADKRTIRVTNANANKTIFVSYTYTPSVQQSFMKFGDNFLPKSSVQMNRIGLLLEGEIWTSNYDPTVDWSTVDTYAAGEVLVAGVNGRFTVNKAGAICSKCYVLQAPKPGSEFLGLYINV